MDRFPSPGLSNAPVHKTPNTRCSRGVVRTLYPRSLPLHTSIHMSALRSAKRRLEDEGSEQPTKRQAIEQSPDVEQITASDGHCDAESSPPERTSSERPQPHPPPSATSASQSAAGHAQRQTPLPRFLPLPDIAEEDELTSGQSTPFLSSHHSKYEHEVLHCYYRPLLPRSRGKKSQQEAGSAPSTAPDAVTQTTSPSPSPRQGFLKGVVSSFARRASQPSRRQRQSQFQAPLDAMTSLLKAQPPDSNQMRPSASKSREAAVLQEHHVSEPPADSPQYSLDSASQDHGMYAEGETLMEGRLETGSIMTINTSATTASVASQHKSFKSVDSRKSRMNMSIVPPGTPFLR
ncbi:hypothetical protein FA95DRAFT_637833 [Auriscalpium vulgare]|uniref:Uncharacterized protein n=1 Tax=Auriscalpium vulgare TaxID=40419 RepID=A0ACB8RCH6_9AGAM|nr:hypothetical protein FA95DRAFT_637833 [Auriscalpium vulgare]